MDDPRRLQEDGGTVKGCVDNPLCGGLLLRPDGKLNVGGAVGTDGRLTVIKDLGLKSTYDWQRCNNSHRDLSVEEIRLLTYSCRSKAVGRSPFGRASSRTAGRCKRGAACLFMAAHARVQRGGPHLP